MGHSDAFKKSLPGGGFVARRGLRRCVSKASSMFAADIDDVWGVGFFRRFLPREWHSILCVVTWKSRFFGTFFRRWIVHLSLKMVSLSDLYNAGIVCDLLF